MKTIRTLKRIRDDTRGQVLLLAAVTIVLLILGTVTYLNVASYTDVNEADGVTDWGGETVESLMEVRFALETAVEYTNQDDSVSTNATRESDILQDATFIDRRLSNQSKSEGGYVDIDTGSMTFTTGVRVWQGEYSDLTISSGSQTNWVVFDNSVDTRAFTLEVTGDNLTSAAGSAFRVDVSYSNGDLAETFFIYEGESGDVIVENSTGETCSGVGSAQDPAQVGFSAGTFNYRTCELLPGTEDIERVEFSNADQINARVNVVADVDSNDVPALSVTKRPFPGSDGDPKAHWATYSATVEVEIQSQYSYMETTVRVAPGLPARAATP
jgi:hypothetical protein